MLGEFPEQKAMDHNTTHVSDRLHYHWRMICARKLNAAAYIKQYERLNPLNLNLIQDCG